MKDRSARGRSVVSRIVHHDAGRDPERLTRKYATIASDPFAFLRGTCHLFYQDLGSSALDERMQMAPRGWVCGDLHLENFGTFKGDNGLTYFDLNDFDEGALAPVTWDLARLSTSLLVAAHSLHIPEGDTVAALHFFLQAYRAAIVVGKAQWVERATARGSVRRLLRQVECRSNAELLAARTTGGKRGRRLKVDGEHALAVADHDREMVAECLRTWTRHQEDPRFFEVLDVARRVAGTGSLGVPRFVVLVRGAGGSEGNVLLDLKAARPSAIAALAVDRGIAQPRWPDEATRVITVQEWAQAASPALLRPISLGADSYVLRALQPIEDRLRYAAWRGRPRRMARALQTMGRVAAWGVLRSASRQGASPIDEWVDWGSGTGGMVAWEKAIVRYARRYRGTVFRDWRSFADAFSAGEVARTVERVERRART